MLVALLSMFSACSEGEDVKDNAPGEEIEITYQVEASGTLEATVEFSDSNGVTKQEITGNWSKELTLPKGHNLYFRVKGVRSGGLVELNVIAIDKSNGNVVFSDKVGNRVSVTFKSDFDFIIKTENLGG